LQLGDRLDGPIFPKGKSKILLYRRRGCDHCEFVSTGDLDLVALNIEVYPNPTEDRLSIRYDATKGGALYANVFDLLGRPVLSNHPLDRPDGASIECSAWQAGIYILQLVDPETQASGTVRVVKL
jgi:Secretion system C-terminal sorting domain